MVQLGAAISVSSASTIKSGASLGQTKAGRDPAGCRPGPPC